MNILLIESQNLYRDGLICLLDGFAEDFSIHGCATMDDALKLIDGDEFDLIILSSRSEASDGLEDMSSLIENATLTPLVLLPELEDFCYFQQALQLGVKGVVTHSSTHEELLAALRLIVAGGIYVPREMVLGSDVLNIDNARRKIGNLSNEDEDVDASKLDLLSVRQTEVLRHLVLGNANKTIADKMNISENTVKTHLSAIFKLLAVRNRTEAVYFATHTTAHTIDHLAVGIASNF